MIYLTVTYYWEVLPQAPLQDKVETAPAICIYTHTIIHVRYTFGFYSPHEVVYLCSQMKGRTTFPQPCIYCTTIEHNTFTG